MTVIFYAALLVAELAFLPETLYPREHIAALEQSYSVERKGQEVSNVAESAADIKRTKQLGLFVSYSIDWL